MTRNLKMLGVALAAVMAMSAVMAATAAQANPPHFRCTAVTATNCVGTGTSNNAVFNVTGGSVKCTEVEGQAGARYKTTAPTTATELTVTAEYGITATEKGCKAFGLKAIVHMNGCDYKFTLVENSNPPTAEVHVNCTGTNKIEITIPGGPCTVKVGSQGPLKHVVFDNNGGAEPTDVTATVTIEGIEYSTEGAGCPHPGATEVGGTYTDEVTFKGFEDTGNPGEYIGGTQVGLHVF